MTAPQKNLNTEQEAAVMHSGGPLLIIAGAGTGKTTVVTERIKHLTQNGAKPSEILALTFTEKASREMEERIDVALPYGYSQLWISTFHSFGDRILRNEAIHIGLNPGYELMSEAEATIFFRKHLFEFDLKYFRPLGNPTKFIGAMLKHFSRLKDEDVSPNQYLDWAQTQNSKLKTQNHNEKIKNEENIDAEKYLELANAYKKYEELKIKEGRLDFADLISNTLLLFRKRPNILKQYQEQFKYILVDEFQDTNYAQYALIKLLAPPDKNPNLLVVGDDNQSIYRFRGAAVSNILMFMEHYKNAEMVVLTKNYRSIQEILDRSYQLIKYNDPDTLEAKLHISKRLESTRVEGEKETVDCLVCDRVEDEAEEVVKAIRKQKTEGRGQREWKDFAILVRANSHAEPFTRALSRVGIPYQFLGPGALFQQPEIKDLIAYLRVLSNIEDSVSLYRVLAHEQFTISPRDLAAISSFSKKFGLSLFDACEIISSLSDNEIPREDREQYNKSIPFLSQSTKDALVKIVKMIHRHLKRIPTETAGQILFYFLEDSGLLSLFTNFKTANEERTSLNIAKFFDKLKTYESEHEDASIPAVMDWIEMRMELGESPLATDTDWAENDAVTILTNHSAKGLEFPVVFMVNLVEGRFPTRQRREPIPIPEELIKEILPVGDYHMEEERRLFYVGMTRAMNKLYLTASYYYGEGKRERKLSPFIAEAIGDTFQKIKRDKDLSNQLFLFSFRKNDEQPILKTTEEVLAQVKRSVSYLSYSQIDTFKFCPLHYKAKYILRLPTPTYAAQSFGSSMHLTLRRFYTGIMQGEKWGKDKLLEIYEEAWIPIGFSGKSHQEAMKREGREELDRFFDTLHANEPTPTVVEKPFVFPVKPGLKAGGVIDRVNIRDDGKIEIIDYKTSINVPTQKDVDKNLQLTMYALAATEVKEPPFAVRPEDIYLTLYFLGTGERRTTTRTQEQLELAKNDIIDIAHQIETSDFACSGVEWCKTCEYKMLCNTSI